MASERRRSPRVRVPDGAGGIIRSTIHVLVEDLSLDGVRLQLETPVRPGSTYAFHAQLDGLDLGATIRITRCKAISPSKGAAARGLLYQAGAEFVWERPGEEARVAAWLARRGSVTGTIPADLDG